MTFKINGFDEEFKRISAIGDGSCMFHSILQSFNKTYIESSDKEKIIICRTFRDDLSNILDEKIDGVMCYDQLSRGELREISENVPEASLHNMKNSLKSKEWGDFRFLELVSNVLNLNIFIISSDTRKLYITGDPELFLKDRDSIIIMNSSNIHFDTVGVKTQIGTRTLFDNNEPLIQKLTSKLYKGV